MQARDCDLGLNTILLVYVGVHVWSAVGLGSPKASFKVKGLRGSKSECFKFEDGFL